MQIIHFSIIALLLTGAISGFSMPLVAADDVVKASIGKQFGLKLLQTGSIASDGIFIHIRSIQDSRCATGVVCIWAGVATAWIDIQKGVDKASFNMTSVGSAAGVSSVNFKNYTLTMIQVTPYPQSKTTIQPTEYTVTLIVNHSNLLSPLKQFKSGIAAIDVECKPGLVLAIKNADGSPACLKPATASDLVARGWAKPTLL